MQKTLGDVTPRRIGKFGRKKGTTASDDKMILRNSTKDPKKTSQELAIHLVGAGVHVSSSTIRRRLLKTGRKARRPVKKQLLTKVMKKKRLIWARQHRDWTVEQWKNVVFSDESQFEVQGQRSQLVRRTTGELIRESHIQQTPNIRISLCYGVFKLQ